MRTNVADAMSKSSHDFLNVVWPRIGEPNGFGTPIPVESVTATTFAAELDTRAGVDVWLIGTDGHMRGLASRVQWGRRSWDTFTIRLRLRSGRPTEYAKRKAAIAGQGVIWPYYTCQGYVTEDRHSLLAAAIARTQDLIAAVDLGIGHEQINRADGTAFWVIPWRDLQAANAPLLVARQ